MAKRTILQTGKTFFLDMLPVVCGVILAFMISNWGEAHKSNKKFEVVKKHIMKELVNNYREFEKAVSEQRQKAVFFEILPDRLDEYSKKEVSLIEAGFPGISVPTVKRTAWDSANNVGIIAMLDFEELQSMTSLYQMQSMILGMVDPIMDIVYGQDVHDPKKLKYVFNSLRLIMSDYLSFSRAMLKAYQDHFLRYAPDILH